MLCIYNPASNIKTKPMDKSKCMSLNNLYVSLYGFDEFIINDWLIDWLLLSYYIGNVIL